MSLRSRSIRPVWWSGSLALTLCLAACFPAVPRLVEERSGKFSLPPEAGCEPSGVVFNGTHCIFVNDKPVPGRSSVFQFPCRNGNLELDTREDLSSPLFRKVKKWEDIAQTPGGRFLLAVTSFDRPQEAYCQLVAWPAGHPAKAHRVGGEILGGIRAVLGGVGWFKIEGLSCIPGNRLLFGIRAVGKSWKENSPVCRIISVSYRIVDGEVRLGNDFSGWYDGGELPIREKAGISGLEFDFENNRLLVLLSIEKGERMGGYLGLLSSPDSVLLLARGRDGNPLRFSRKSEGIAVLDRERILVVYDDDRVEAGGRKKNEAVYEVFRFE